MTEIIETIATVIGWIALGCVFILVLALIFAFPTMWLWNWLMPEVFNLPRITVWQSLGLIILFNLLLPGKSGGKSKD